jgi:hypothetical protein
MSIILFYSRIQDDGCESGIGSTKKEGGKGKRKNGRYEKKRKN